MKIEHIGIEIDDFYVMELFYKKIFGFKTIYRYVSKNTPGLQTIMLEKGNFNLELLHRKRDENFTKSKDINHYHINFKVENVLEEYNRLLQLGITKIVPPKKTGDGFLEFYLKDPENNMIEISNKVLDFKGGAIKAVIFDLDGTLIDSEDNYYEADKILLSRYGIDFTQEDKKQYIGTGNLEMMKRIKLRYNINETAETLLEKKNSLYLNLAKNNTKVFSEMKEFLNLLKDNNYPLAVASGSSPIILEELLTSLDLKKYFDIIVSAEEVKKGKPAPDIFLETANRLNIEPHNCCVIEDSQYGVEAAKKAFMYCIAIPYLTEKPLADSFTLADLIFEDGMKQFLAKKAFDWVKEF